VRLRAEVAMAAKTNFRGSFTALVTPFRNGSIDEAAFRGIVNWQIAEGTSGLVPVGTTGESPTLSHAEHRKVVEWTVEEARGRAPVVAGAGSNSTAEAIDFAQHAEKAGADAVLIRTTTSRRRKGCTSTSRPLTMRSASRSSSTTFLPAP
jgi:4-hydroxy-tetrahydrodipicolinate synthase